jgi:hypothetical protein
MGVSTSAKSTGSKGLRNIAGVEEDAFTGMRFINHHRGSSAEVVRAFSAAVKNALDEDNFVFDGAVGRRAATRAVWILIGRLVYDGSFASADIDFFYGWIASHCGFICSCVIYNPLPVETERAERTDEMIVRCRGKLDFSSTRLAVIFKFAESRVARFVTHRQQDCRDKQQTGKDNQTFHCYRSF